MPRLPDHLLLETPLTKRIRVALNKTQRCRVVRNQIAKGWMSRGPKKPTLAFMPPFFFMRTGLGDGSPDLVGVLRSGRCFCVEVKTATGRVRPDQERWWKAARGWGILGGVARSVEEAMGLLEEAEHE